jgi:hypothetical protein
MLPLVFGALLWQRLVCLHGPEAWAVSHHPITPLRRGLF